MWRTTLFTLFPKCSRPVGLSLSGEALSRGLVVDRAKNVREHGLGRHRNVDDNRRWWPGMVIRADVLAAALDASSRLTIRVRACG